MNKNVGSIDRIIRIIAGIGLLAFALVGPETGYNYLGFIGIVPLVTALLGWCPAYTLFGIKTCKISD
ncbi:hypothetical protein GCM10011332_04640 [Terasakiella brassicae]|uniref:Inner membrane protein YgaP-like transmembrane domain-containing protein n=1 Tax=Terasakiella brassicae TaxID=1634917 RepID=A0A917BRK9_9PROT|nr:DUF2892 domain-containing protein [Terasakiella brassicae]GGF54314.1 hypothetical protein GCM10011332_04640 [Terasakiella brassicae]